jgi:hypothetical protein
MLLQTLQVGLAGTAWGRAQAGTIRVTLLKVAARVVVRSRLVRVPLPSAYPWQGVGRKLVAWLAETAAPSRDPAAVAA